MIYPLTSAYRKLSEAKIYGPYEGSDANDGRPIYVKKYKDKNGKWRTTSINKARLDYEVTHNTKLPKDQHVDHKDNNKNNDDPNNLRTMPSSENIAKENKRRAK